MKPEWGLIAKILVISTLLAGLIKYGLVNIEIAPTLTVVLIAICLPALGTALWLVIQTRKSLHADDSGN